MGDSVESVSSPDLERDDVAVSTDSCILPRAFFLLGRDPEGTGLPSMKTDRSDSCILSSAFLLLARDPEGSGLPSMENDWFSLVISPLRHAASYDLSRDSVCEELCEEGLARPFLAARRKTSTSGWRDTV